MARAWVGLVPSGKAEERRHRDQLTWPKGTTVFAPTSPESRELARDSASYDPRNSQRRVFCSFLSWKTKQVYLFFHAGVNCIFPFDFAISVLCLYIVFLLLAVHTLIRHLVLGALVFVHRKILFVDRSHFFFFPCSVGRASEQTVVEETSYVRGKKRDEREKKNQNRPKLLFSGVERPLVETGL